MKDSSMLADPSLTELERRLRLRRIELRQQIAAAHARVEERPLGEVSDAKDAADAGAQLIVVDAEVERDLAELRDINLALQRIDDGTYGGCNDCGNRIDPRRIVAQPTALRCVECQTRAEARATGTSGRPRDRRP
jgi:DnaK suppressor protein